MLERLKHVDVAAWIPRRIRIWLLPFFLALFAIFGLSLAVFLNSLESNRSSKLLYATGTVVEVAHGSKPSCPVIQFTGVSGTTGRFRGNACSKPPAFSVGDRVAVSYVAGPADAQMAETEGIGHIGVFLFALIWLYLAVRAAYSAFQQSREIGWPKR